MPSKSSSVSDRPGERRRAKRFAASLEIEYRTLTQNPIYGSVSSLDLSRGGLAFETPEEIRKGDSIELRMNVPGDNLPVFASGTVAWADGVRAGVRLTRIAKADQARILEYLYRDWLKARILERDAAPDA
jgi:c-di-GMP-binding flagellar brake protein YcgR